MKTSQLLLIVSIGLVIACNPEKKEVLKSQDLVEQEKLKHELLRKNIEEANTVLDSIDILTKHDVIAHENTKPTVAERLRGLQKRIIAMEETLAKTESDLKVSRNEASAYMMMANAYKSEVSILFNELQQLEDSVSYYKTNNVGQPMARK